MKLLLFGEETKRLHFRKVVETDYPDWLPFFLEKDVAKYLLLDSALSQKQLCDKWFEKLNHRYINNLGGMNGLICKKTKRFIGQCGLLNQTIEGTDYLEVGYSILPEFWGKGYASEAAIKCRDYAFENDLTDSLISIIHKENIGSKKVAIRNGMSLYKDNLIGENKDFDLFRITKKEWLKLS